MAGSINDVDKQKTTNRCPILIFFHGGGWSMFSSQTRAYHHLCTKFASSGFIVLSVDYRLAPEHPFPAAVFDSFDVVRWVASRPNESYLKHAEFSNVTLAGDSAGGNLALVVATLARDGLGPDLKPLDSKITISQLLLIYPGLLMNRFVKESTPTTIPFLSRPVGEFFYQSYVPGKDLKEKHKVNDTERRICPILAGFHGLPRTIMISGGADFLRHENKMAANQMIQSGVAVVYRTVDHMPHAFLTLLELPEVDESIKWIIQELIK